MKLTVDGKEYAIRQGETILDAIRRAGLDSDSLRQRPLAAQIGGDVYSLGYAPEADCALHLLHYNEDFGQRVYEHTLQFCMTVAMRKLFPGARVLARYSLGAGLYITIQDKTPFTAENVLELESEMRALVRRAVPLVRKRIPTKEAHRIFEADGQEDKAALLKWRKREYFDIYEAEGYQDYLYGEMCPDTSYADVFRLQYMENSSFLLLLPRAGAPDVVGEYTPQPKLGAIFHQSDEWSRLMGCDSVSELNERVQNGGIRELIRVNEALHSRNYSQVADDILARGAKAVLVAGPSSSGKTTSAHRIATQLRVMGHDPILLSLDNYYIDRDKIPTDENGQRDLEHINTLDTPRFGRDLAALLKGKKVEVPVFDFMTGKRAPEGIPLQLGGGQILIIEGIHGLNPMLLDEAVDESEIYRIYVSALTTLNVDDHNRIRTTDMRLLRRLVRDYKTRNASMEVTLSMWNSVRKGEQTWIFPYQENADTLINTTLIYEVVALKRYVYPLLWEVKPESPYYAAARAIVKALNYVADADIEDEIPPTSILREFIGGNTYYKK